MPWHRIGCVDDVTMIVENSPGRNIVVTMYKHKTMRALVNWIIKMAMGFGQYCGWYMVLCFGSSIFASGCRVIHM